MANIKDEQQTIESTSEELGALKRHMAGVVRCTTPRPKWSDATVYCPEALTFLWEDTDAPRERGRPAATSHVVGRIAGHIRANTIPSVDLELLDARAQLRRLRTVIGNAELRMRELRHYAPGPLTGGATKRNADGLLLEPTDAVSLDLMSTEFKVKARGYGRDVPKYLQYEGLVSIRLMGKNDLEALTQIIWREKRAYEVAIDRGVQLRDFFLIFTKNRSSGNLASQATEAYNIVYALQQYAWDVKCDMFLAILLGDVSEKVLDDQQQCIDDLNAFCRRVQDPNYLGEGLTFAERRATNKQQEARQRRYDRRARGGGSVGGVGSAGSAGTRTTTTNSRRSSPPSTPSSSSPSSPSPSSPHQHTDAAVKKQDIFENLAVFFPLKARASLDMLKLAVNKMSRTPTVSLRALFDPKADSQLVMAVRKQHFREIKAHMEKMSASLRSLSLGGGETVLFSIAQCLQRVDPKMTRERQESFLAGGLDVPVEIFQDLNRHVFTSEDGDATSARTANLDRFIANLQRSCVIKPELLWNVHAVPIDNVKVGAEGGDEVGGLADGLKLGYKERRPAMLLSEVEGGGGGKARRRSRWGMLRAIISISSASKKRPSEQ